MTQPKNARKQKLTLSDDKEVDVKRATLRKSPSTLAKTSPPTKIDLFILRHGEAGNRMTVVAEDSERPLTVEGRAEIQKIAKSLKAVGLQIDRIFSSPLRRALETAEIAATILKIPALEQWDELKPDGSKSTLYRKLARLERSSRAMLVGHEPYLSSMIGEIIGTTGARLILKKGGLGKIRITSFTPKISGELRWLLTPKMITKMS